jgi:hypothetical protein
MWHASSVRCWTLLVLLLVAFPAPHSCAAAAVLRVASVSQLVAAVVLAPQGGTTTELVLSAHLVLLGARVVVPAGAQLTLRGDAAACGPPAPFAWADSAAGMCVISAASLSGHFVVSDGASLTLDGIALVDGANDGGPGGCICVGVCDSSGVNASPDAEPVGGTLVLRNSLLANSTAGMSGVWKSVRRALRPPCLPGLETFARRVSPVWPHIVDAAGIRPRPYPPSAAAWACAYLLARTHSVANERRLRAAASTWTCFLASRPLTPCSRTAGRGKTCAKHRL